MPDIRLIVSVISEAERKLNKGGLSLNIKLFIIVNDCGLLAGQTAWFAGLILKSGK